MTGSAVSSPFYRGRISTLHDTDVPCPSQSWLAECKFLQWGSIFLFKLFLRHSSWAPILHSGLRPRIDFPQKNKCSSMQHAKSSFLKWHCFVSSLVLWRRTSNKPQYPCSKAVVTKDSGPTHLSEPLKQAHISEWDTCCSLQEDRSRSESPAIKQLTLADTFNYCVPYEKKGYRLSAVTDAVTLHIVRVRANKYP